MKKKIITLVAILVIGIVTATTVYASTFLSITIDGTFDYDEANKVLDIVNQERSKVGKSNLTIDYELTKKAQTRAEEAALYFSHTRTDGSDVLKSMKLNGENLAGGYGSAESVVEGWMESDGHRANILNNNHKSIGIASFKTEDGNIYWVQVFSWSNSSSTKKFTGTKKVSGDSVKIKSDFLKAISIRDFPNKTIKAGEEYKITGLKLQTTATSSSTTINNSNAKWTSSDTKVATVSNGTIKGIGSGEATITATLNGLKTTWKIKVEGNATPVEKLTTKNQSVTLTEGESTQLAIEVSPSSATDKSITWTVADKDIAKVDSNGKVTAIKAGFTTVEAKTSNNKTLTYNIYVEAKEINITNIMFTSTTNSLNVGDTFKVEVYSKPSNATEKVSYKSSNTKVVTIDSNGNLKAVGEGTATVTAYSKNKSESFKITISKKSNTNNTSTETPKEEVKQEDNTPKEIPVQEVKLNCTEVTLKVGETYNFKYTIYPANANVNTRATWEGPYYKMAELYSDGRLVARSAGEGTVTVHVGGKTASFKVKVIAPNEVKSLSISGRDRFTTNEATVLTAIVNPTDAAVYNDLTWTSSNPEIVKVMNDKTGLIYTFDKKGTAVITVRSSNGVSASKTITVE